MIEYIRNCYDRDMCRDMRRDTRDEMNRINIEEIIVVIFIRGMYRLTVKFNMLKGA